MTLMSILLYWWHYVITLSVTAACSINVMHEYDVGAVSEQHCVSAINFQSSSELKRILDH